MSTKHFNDYVVFSEVMTQCNLKGEIIESPEDDIYHYLFQYDENTFFEIYELTELEVYEMYWDIKHLKRNALIRKYKNYFTENADDFQYMNECV